MSLLAALRRAIAEHGLSIHFSRKISETGYRKWAERRNGVKPSWIVIHHSFSADKSTIRDWVGIRKFHMSWRFNGDIISPERANDLVRQGRQGVLAPWRDIGYHFGIEMVEGALAVQNGRAIGDIGAHAEGFNAKSIGICVVGNFDAAPPSDQQIFLLAGLCRQLQREFSIPREQVIGHRDTFTARGVPVLKSCPGQQFSLEALRARLIDPKEG